MKLRTRPNFSSPVIWRFKLPDWVCQPSGKDAVGILRSFFFWCFMNSPLVLFQGYLPMTQEHITHCTKKGIDAYLMWDYSKMAFNTQGKNIMKGQQAIRASLLEFILDILLVSTKILERWNTEQSKREEECQRNGLRTSSSRVTRKVQCWGNCLPEGSERNGTGANFLKCLSCFAGLTVASGNLIQFADLIRQVTGKFSLLSYNEYGCYCGLGGSKQPLDKTDWWVKILEEVEGGEQGNIKIHKYLTSCTCWITTWRHYTFGMRRKNWYRPWHMFYWGSFWFITT